MTLDNKKINEYGEIRVQSRTRDKMLYCANINGDRPQYLPKIDYKKHIVGAECYFKPEKKGLYRIYEDGERSIWNFTGSEFIFIRWEE